MRKNDVGVRQGGLWGKEARAPAPAARATDTGTGVAGKRGAGLLVGRLQALRHPDLR